MYRCECQPSEEYVKYFEEVAKLPTDSQRLLKVVMEPFEGQEYSVKCKGCADLEMMDGLVSASSLPDVYFDWDNAEPNDFVALAESDVDMKSRELGRAMTTGESILPSSTRKILMHWSGIEDDEVYCRYVEIGHWISDDRRLREMTDEELEEYRQVKIDMRGMFDQILSPEMIQQALTHYEEMKAVTDSLEKLFEAEE